MGINTDKAVNADLANLEQVLAADTSGVKLKAISAHLEDLAQEAEKQAARQGFSSEGQMSGQVAASCRAAQRTVRRMWDASH